MSPRRRQKGTECLQSRPKRQKQQRPPLATSSDGAAAADGGLLLGLGSDALLCVIKYCRGREICGLLRACRSIRDTLLANQDLFKTLSIELCGELCLQRAGTEPWSEYYLRRVSHAPAAPTHSPLVLVQERHARNAYTLLASVQLCSRTSGGATVRGVIDTFFDLFPTPTAVLAADMAALRALLLPLGLNRERTITRFALGFVTLPWTDPKQLHGCGKLAADSWRIFCLGATHACARDATVDPVLRAYCRAVGAAPPETQPRAAEHTPAAPAKRRRTATAQAAERGRERGAVRAAAAAAQQKAGTRHGSSGGGSSGRAATAARRRSPRLSGGAADAGAATTAAVTTSLPHRDCRQRGDTCVEARGGGRAQQGGGCRSMGAAKGAGEGEHVAHGERAAGGAAVAHRQRQRALWA